jgi:hypothetical protein
MVTQEQLLDLAAMVGAIGAVLIDKGMTTRPELEQLRTDIKAAMEQKQAQERREAIAADPSIELLEKVLGLAGRY